MASTAATRAPLLEHPDLTTIGLLAETHAGLSATFERQLAERGLSLQWFELLARLARTPEHRLRMTDLAAQSTLTASGLTRAVDRLAAAGLVTREACPTDRRSTYAVLTDAGEREVLDALPEHVALLDDVLDALTPQERHTLAGLLRKLRDAANPCAAQASAPEGLS